MGSTMNRRFRGQAGTVVLALLREPAIAVAAEPLVQEIVDHDIGFGDRRMRALGPALRSVPRNVFSAIGPASRRAWPSSFGERRTNRLCGSAARQPSGPPTRKVGALVPYLNAQVVGGRQRPEHLEQVARDRALRLTA